MSATNEPGLLTTFEQAPTETQVAFALSLTRKALAILDEDETGGITSELIALVRLDIEKNSHQPQT